MQPLPPLSHSVPAPGGLLYWPHTLPMYGYEQLAYSLCLMSCLRLMPAWSDLMHLKTACSFYRCLFLQLKHLYFVCCCGSRLWRYYSLYCSCCLNSSSLLYCQCLYCQQTKMPQHLMYLILTHRNPVRFHHHLLLQSFLQTAYPLQLQILFPCCFAYRILLLPVYCCSCFRLIHTKLPKIQPLSQVLLL